MPTRTLICGACGYQWDDITLIADLIHFNLETARNAASTFNLYCPACEANVVHKFEPTKERLQSPGRKERL